ncbi:hypothetical protein P7K49_002372, partial [Saguinus oedipus]
VCLNSRPGSREQVGPTGVQLPYRAEQGSLEKEGEREDGTELGGHRASDTREMGSQMRPCCSCHHAALQTEHGHVTQ